MEKINIAIKITNDEGEVIFLAGVGAVDDAIAELGRFERNSAENV